MKKTLITGLLLTGSLQLFAQEHEVKQEKWIASVGVNFGATGKEDTFLAVENYEPSTFTTKLFNFELAAKRRINDNSKFFVGLSTSFSSAIYDRENEDRDAFKSEYNIFSIGPSITLLLKNKSGTIANTLSFIPSYNRINYDFYLKNRLSKEASSNGLGVKFEYMPIFYLNQNMSIGPKFSIQRTMFGDFDQTVLINDKNNFNFRGYDHLQMQFGVQFNMHF